MRLRNSLVVPLGLLWLLGTGSGTVAQESPTIGAGTAPPQSGRPTSQAGIEVPTFGGPNSVGQELEDQARPKEYRFRMLQNLLEPWFDWKQRVNKKHGFTLGFNATLLGQYGEGSIGDRDVAGGGLKGFLNDNLWLGAMAYDANAVSGEFDLDTLDAGAMGHLDKA